MEANTTTAVTVWGKAQADEVAAIIAAGKSVPKALATLAPKGHIPALRATRRAGLTANSAFLTAQLAEKNFRVYDMKASKTLKNGVVEQQVTFRTPQPTSSMTMAEYAAVTGISVEKLTEAAKMVK